MTIPDSGAELTVLGADDLKQVRGGAGRGLGLGKTAKKKKATKKKAKKKVAKKKK